ncbi:MAG TPA: sigma-70 family RNA polymerase sigma factor [Candidatus Limnocylindrales bacterium]|jgi:RNA polymerase sigma-70 factor (ECF subfamily)
MDSRLLADLAADLDAAFERLVLAHQDRLYTIALRLLGDPRDAEEVAQDALVRAYRALATYDADRILELRLRPWLATIAINLCRNRGRRRTPILASLEVLNGADPTAERRPLAAAAIEPSPGPLETALRRESAAHWAGLVLRLPERYRVPIVLRHVDGLSYDEMAQALGRPEGTLKAQVHRGLSLLRSEHERASNADHLPAIEPAQEMTA